MVRFATTILGKMNLLQNVSSSFPTSNTQHPLIKCLAQTRFFYSLLKFDLRKDSALDEVIISEKNMKDVHHFLTIFRKFPDKTSLPINVLGTTKTLEEHRDVLRLLRLYPTIFVELSRKKLSSPPHFRLSSEVIDIFDEEKNLHEKIKNDHIMRICKLLMMTKKGFLPLRCVTHLRWDLGLPDNFVNAILRKSPSYFRIIDTTNIHGLPIKGVQLVQRNPAWAVSAVEKTAMKSGDFVKGMPLAFSLHYPIHERLTLADDYLEWLDDWQDLPYVSPYDLVANKMYGHGRVKRSVMEKRMVSVMHEILHLMVRKKVIRRRLVPLWRCLPLKRKFWRCFERHPGIFYISEKTGLKTAVLREAFCGSELVEPHPLVAVREKYARLMRAGLVVTGKDIWSLRKSYNIERLSGSTNVDCGDFVVCS